ncbi:MAG: hypothetical protein QXW10_03715 [Candidatus Micrarchaeaceae archaeon]
MSEQNTFLKGLVYRLIRKHISGTTVNTAFRLTKDLNDKEMPATITFLNENVGDTGKARYNLNSYIQLVKQISRLSLNASISVRLSQLGFSLPNGIIERNMLALLTTAKSSKVSVWLEYEDPIGLNKLVDMCRRYSNLYDGIGVELPLQHPGIERIVDNLPETAAVKFISHYNMSGLGDKKADKSKAKQKGVIDAYSYYIDKLSKRKAAICIQEPDEKTIYRLAKANKQYKRDLIFELPLGYSKRWQSKLMKEKIRVSVYVPYGKDWIPYAINKLTEGRIRELAVSILDGKAGTSGGNEKPRKG